ncbi:MAG: hypothetical protein K9J16_14575 [Melioribacteraceae bacterium]|nr:hypothetical protein [Melioribacteraceae bacterium]MCF8356908.1 hypothetical protein [Melioribacteraceae bacterium]MCF8396275.1 hypothetical protein [Melioribacteraceae bacterium]MCF8420649.1 hypothetical protein [Melioribacteraceae bacterium]
MNPNTNIPKGIKLGWYGGSIGGYLFLPIISILFFYIGYLIYGIIAISIFILGVYYISRFTPWNYPDLSYGKLILPLIAPISIFSFIIAAFPPEFNGEEISAWAYIIFGIFIFQPVIPMWKLNYRNISADQNKI